MHSSSWLGHSWEFADIVDSIRVQQQRGASDGCRVQVGIVSRREKFRLVAGPSREELLWEQILCILRKIRVPKLPCLEASVCPASSSECNTHRPLASFNGGREQTELNFKGELESVSWPFDAVGDMRNMAPLDFSWENVPESADPMRGSGYKAVSLAPKVEGRQIRENDTEEEDDSGNGHCCMGRGERKQLQVENIASALSSFDLKAGSKVVDFGCGSGALTLPLAALLPKLCFVGVDFKQQSITLLEKRAWMANLRNVAAFHGRIEVFSEPFDACVALHACGIATDLALLQALKHKAAYVMSPCCVGKLQIPIEQVIMNSTQHMQSQTNMRSFSASAAAADQSNSPNIDRPNRNLNNHSRSSVDCNEMEIEASNASLFVDGTDSSLVPGKVCEPTELPVSKESIDNVSLGLAYPRSKWLRSCILESEFQVLARAADWSSYDHESSSSRLHSLCKIVLELDRNEASRELGYSTDLFSLSNEKAGTVGVSHILVGKPANLSGIWWISMVDNLQWDKSKSLSRLLLLKTGDILSLSFLIQRDDCLRGDFSLRSERGELGNFLSGRFSNYLPRLLERTSPKGTSLLRRQHVSLTKHNSGSKDET